MNSVNIIGRLTAEPELRRTTQGTACCSFSLAVKRPRAKDTTDFLNFVVWQQGAEYLCQYGHKGDVVGVTGHLISRNWEDKNGNKRTTVEVNCDSVELLSSKKNSEVGGNTTQPQNSRQNGASYAQQGFGGYKDYAMINDPDAELPF